MGNRKGATRVMSELRERVRECAIRHVKARKCLVKGDMLYQMLVSVNVSDEYFDVNALLDEIIDSGDLLRTEINLPEIADDCFVSVIYYRE